MPALLLAGYGVGFVLAAQVGPVTLLIVRSVVRGGRAVAVALAMAAAVALIDLLYATLGVAGVGRLLGGGGIRLAFGLLSAAILIAIGARTLWIGIRARAGLESAEEVVMPRRAFATTIAATALNPLTIALWTISFPAAVPSTAAATTTRTASSLSARHSEHSPGTEAWRRRSRSHANGSAHGCSPSSISQPAAA